MSTLYYGGNLDILRRYLKDTKPARQPNPSQVQPIRAQTPKTLRKKPAL